MGMARIAIVADDLTGALDAAAPLRRQGFPATVALAPRYLPFSLEADIVAVTTESRYLTDSGPILASVVAALPRECLLYKKIDSTLRGPIATEMRLLLAASGRRYALVTPTLPHQGRALIDGFLVIDGERTNIHLPTLLASSGLPTIDVPLAVVRDPTALQRVLERASESTTAVVAVDAVTDDDLRAVGQAVARLHALPLLAGSAGLAAWLPRITGLTPSLRPSDDVAPLDGPVLFAFGSAHPRTHAQLDELRRGHVTTITVDPAADVRSSITTCIATLANGDDAVLSVVPPPDTIEAVPYTVQHAVAQMLARTVAAILERVPVAALVLGGGDTAYAVCAHLGIEHLALLGEVLSGLPLSVGTTSAGRRLYCVTKAGGFGTPDALRHVRATLHGASQ
jgi:uncharacterized protein YgbK (DUF1537 family)